jgi:hypothetical protein
MDQIGDLIDWQAISSNTPWWNIKVLKSKTFVMSVLTG